MRSTARLLILLLAVVLGIAGRPALPPVDLGEWLGAAEMQLGAWQGPAGAPEIQQSLPDAGTGPGLVPAAGGIPADPHAATGGERPAFRLVVSPPARDRYAPTAPPELSA